MWYSSFKLQWEHMYVGIVWASKSFIQLAPGRVNYTDYSPTGRVPKKVKFHPCVQEGNLTTIVGLTVQYHALTKI